MTERSSFIMEPSIKDKTVASYLKKQNSHGCGPGPAAGYNVIGALSHTS